MRCLQHVLWRGALALGLLVSGGTGAMLMPQPPTSACNVATGHVDLFGTEATATRTGHALPVPVRDGAHLAGIRTGPARDGAC